jgi:DNA polymerase I-like protein with 3'-5' exonuclease and polymerase domains
MTYPQNSGLLWDEPAPKRQGLRVMPKIPDDIKWTPPKEFPRLDAAKELIIDVETYDPDLKSKGPGVRRDGYIIGLAVATEDRSWYFPMHHDHPYKYDPNGYNLPRETVLKWARRELCRPGIPKIGANLLYDLDYLWHEGVEVPGPYYDILIAEPLIDENQYVFSLESTAQKYLGEGKKSERLYEWLAAAYGGKPTRQGQGGNIWRAPPELVGEYALGDVELPRDILRAQRDIIGREGLDRVFDVETRLIPMMLGMRRRGVPVDMERSQRMDAELGGEAEAIRRNLAQKGIDPNRSVTIAEYCRSHKFEHAYTADGNPSFVSDWLEDHEDPTLRSIAVVRELEKLKGTFVQGAILGNAINGRIHCQFNQLKNDQYGTVSGRFSSSNPNLQNIPTRTELGARIRTLFLPEDGEDWYSDDWSQIEFRMLVHYAFAQYGRDPRGSAAQTRQAYLEDSSTDFHKVVADLTGIDRKPAKNINFGLVYGMGEPTMARNLGRTLDAVKPLFEQYHNRLPFIKELYNECNRRAKSRHWIQTYLGRRRRWNRFESTDWDTAKADGPMSEEAAKKMYGSKYRTANTHKALNALLQGSAADIMKIAMVDIWEAGICDVLGAPLSTVHDELNWSVPRTEEAQQAHNEAKRIMETCVKLNLPLLCDSNYGANWGEAK